VNKITYLTPHFAVTGFLQPADFRKIADLGFKSVLSNLPDGESSSYLSASEEAELASSADLGFRHVPAIKSEVFSDGVVDAVGQALADLESPVLAHCASGIRSAIAWAAAAARSQPADCVIAALKNAGYDLAVLRDELEDQRGRAHAAATPAALDCHCKEQGESVV
jgi:sulfide:quinone oxidoreductase